MDTSSICTEREREEDEERKERKKESGNLIRRIGWERERDLPVERSFGPSQY